MKQFGNSSRLVVAVMMSQGLAMSKTGDGDFSKNLFSLQLQLETLLEGSGGKKTIEFLDALSQLSKTEQDIALRIFRNVADKLAIGEKRIMSDQDKELKKFEDDLYDDIIAYLEAQPSLTKTKLRVIDGGMARKPRPNSLINLSEVRKSRSKPVLA